MLTVATTIYPPTVANLIRRDKYTRVSKGLTGRTQPPVLAGPECQCRRHGGHQHWKSVGDGLSFSTPAGVSWKPSSMAKIPVKALMRMRLCR